MEFFSPDSDPKLFSCPCGSCDYKPTKRLLDCLDETRGRAGVPFVISSGPRCPAYNQSIGGAPFSEHMDGDGADVACYDSRTRFLIIQAAIHSGINRIGIAKTFVHLGVSPSNDQDVVWVY